MTGTPASAGRPKQTAPVDIDDAVANRGAPRKAAHRGRPNQYAFSQQIGHLLRRAYQTHLAIFQQHSSDPQLTSVQFVTLCALRDNGPSSQAELVKATKIDQATIRGIVDRLKTRGLIRLATDTADRRKIIMSLTEDGDVLLSRMIPCAQRISELTMEKLNPAERAAVVFVLRKMIEPDDE